MCGEVCCFVCGRKAVLKEWFWPVTADAPDNIPLQFAIAFWHADGDCLWQFSPKVYPAY